MNKLIVFVLLIGSTSCVTAEIKEKSDPFERKYAAVGSPGFFTENSDIRVDYVPNTVTARIPVTVRNKASSPIKIIWDESVFIDGNGTSTRVFHAGVKIADRGSAIPPSLLAPQTQIQDMIVPTDRVFWDYNGWYYRPLCGTVPHMFSAEGDSFSKDKTEDSACVGQTYGFLITYEVGTKKRSIKAQFKYSDRSLKPVPQPSPRTKTD